LLAGSQGGQSPVKEKATVKILSKKVEDNMYKNSKSYDEYSHKDSLADRIAKAMLDEFTRLRCKQRIGVSCRTNSRQNVQ
jgi:hypothetical protein